MFDKCLVPLYMLYCMDGEIRGRTRFQKLIFLTKQTGKEDNSYSIDIEFTRLFYGPFSRDLMEALKTQNKEGTVEEQLEESSYGLTYNYKLTNKGRCLVEDAINRELISKKLQERAIRIAKEFGDKPLDELIAYVYNKYPDFDPHRQ